MKKYISFIIILFSLSSMAQTKVGDLTLPNSMKIGEKQAQLNGAGTRVKLWMDLYAMGLYLTEKNNNADHIIAKDDNMGIRLEIISGLITAEKMEKATRDGFKHSTKGNMKEIHTKIEDFLAVFKSGVEKKDVFEFAYIPAKGTAIYKNGELQKTIEGLSFKKALFGIWLCNKPADKNLKEKLLK